MNDVKLSIITPYYETLSYTLLLADVLTKQLNKNVEWIIVDDGCHCFNLDQIANNNSDKLIKIIHLKDKSGNASYPRNVGLDNANGEYISFIDSDDLVPSYYVDKIIDKIDSTFFDYCYLSWKSGDDDYIITDEPLEWNSCVWNCVYNKNTIGNTRFDLKKNIGEDKAFNELVRKGKKENIIDIMYYYNWKRPGSISMRYREGLIPFTRE